MSQEIVTETASAFKATSQEEGTTSFEGDVPQTAGLALDTMTLNTDLADRNENLDKFLERPVVIGTYTWTGTTAASTFKPWGLWAADPAVRRKLNNYAFFSGNLHIRYEINATPYHYGCLLACYMPNPFVNPNYDANTVKALPQCFEQTHVEIEPQRDGVYEMVCPFLYNSRKFSLSRNSIASLGVISMVPMMALKLSNAATITPVSIRIYAWVTDVILEAPTVANVIKYQSAKISKPPKLTTKARGILDTAYDIGNTIIGWAEWLGFSRPPVVTSYSLYAQRNLDLTNVEGTDNIQVLAMSSKSQRPLYFPTVGADNPDPLSIVELCGREGIVYWPQTLAWPTTSAPDTVVTSIPVTPAIMSMAGLAANNQVYLPPCSYFSQRFTYWRGTMIYRIKVNCSKQHSGKLRIYYDPLGAPNSFTTAPDDPQNTTRVYIMDVSTETDVEFSIGWCNDKPYLPLQVEGKIFDVLNATAAEYPASNGFLTIETSSYLSAPLAAADATIQVFVRAGDDFELIQPNDWDIFKFASLAPIVAPALLPALETVIEHQSGIFKREFKKANKIELAPSQQTGEYAIELCGERAISWRPFLKRYQAEMTASVSGAYTVTANTYDVMSAYFPKYPSITKPYLDATSTPFAPYLLNMTLIGICFAGQRGGVKSKIILPPRLNSAVSLSDVQVRFNTALTAGYFTPQAFTRAAPMTVPAFLTWMSSLNHNTGDVHIANMGEPLGCVFHDYSSVLFEPNSLTHNYNSGSRTYSCARTAALVIPNSVDGVGGAPVVMSSAADDYDVVAYTMTPKIVFNTTYTQPTFQNNL